VQKKLFVILTTIQDWICIIPELEVVAFAKLFVQR